MIFERIEITTVDNLGFTTRWHFTNANLNDSIARAILNPCESLAKVVAIGHVK